MVQEAKVIDVTRTYVPIDPQAFPQGLHLSAREETVENRVPVSAYQGHNFMPTGYGYKSYFGTNAKIDANSLPARVDKIFIFQNNAFKNVLIALCDTGIWIKDGNTAGDWVQNVVIEPNVNPAVHFEWTLTNINNALYAYRQGFPSYHKITSNINAPFVTITAVTPNFLNMQGQLGIFKAGNRLGFWDSENSVSWSNLDDFTDFTPSIETLAGAQIFTDVQGRIVTIIPHGEGFIIYATKSIVFIKSEPNTLFQWDPKVLVSNDGIAFQNQAVAAAPDTKHFAITSSAIYQIEEARISLIVPEFFDYIKEAQQPIALSVLENRHLCFETIEPDVINGVVAFTENVSDPITITFPGSFYTPPDFPDPDLITPDVLCSEVGKVSSQGRNFSGTNLASPPPDTDNSTFYEPIWTCYLSRNGVVDPSNITWTNTPVATIDPNGIEKNHSPLIPGNLASLTSDKTHKRAVTGAEAYLDGKWTMQRFVQAQMAIWKEEEAAIAAVKQVVSNRNSTGTKITNTGATNPSGQPVARSEAFIDTYPSKFSSPRFGFSKCAFWLTRFAIEAYDLFRVKSNNIVGVPVEHTFSLWKYSGGFNQGVDSGFIYPTAEAAAAAYANPADGISAGQAFYVGDSITAVSVTGVVSGVSGAIRLIASPGNIFATASRTILGLSHWDRTETMHAFNKAVDKPLTPTPESPFCEITGWRYKDKLGNVITIPATSCDTPGDLLRKKAPPILRPPPGPAPGPNSNPPLPLDQLTGSFCGNPFDPPLSLDGTPIIWPSTSITIPGGSFLLQAGSPAPVYPTYVGAFVFDTALKKWGKLKTNYKKLLDYSPINSNLNGVIPYETFGIVAGVIKADGFVYLFDRFPADSFITYGKVGYYRLGKTQFQELRVDFKTPFTGSITIDTSLHGRNLASGFSTVANYENVTSAVVRGGYPGKWHNISIEGVFDIVYMEYRANIAGRR